MKVLITGGAGFIGSETALQLLADGHEVTILDNFLPQVHGENPENSFTWSMIRENVETISGDVRDLELVRKLVPRHEALLHLAAETGTGQSMYDIARYTDTNVMGTANVLQAIVQNRGHIAKVVVASSRSIYGEGEYLCTTHANVFPQSREQIRLVRGEFEPVCPVCGDPVTVLATTEQAYLAPASIYAATKLAQENLVLASARAQQLPAYALRYQNVYGPGQSLSNPYTGILSIFSREMLAGRPIEIFEDGLESRDFVHVRDIARANLLALTSSEIVQVALNVGSGIGVGVLNLAHMLAKVYGFEGDITISGRFRAGDIRHNFANTTLIEKALGFVPRMSLSDGLESFTNWVQEQGVITGGTTYAESLSELSRRGLISTTLDH